MLKIHNKRIVFKSSLVRLFGQEIAYNQSRSARSVRANRGAGVGPYLHVVVVSSHREREAALNLWVSGIDIRAFQRATGQHGFLVVIESNLSELFPVADQMGFDNDFVECQGALFRFQYAHMIIPRVSISRL